MRRTPVRVGGWAVVHQNRGALRDGVKDFDSSDIERFLRDMPTMKWFYDQQKRENNLVRMILNISLNLWNSFLEFLSHKDVVPLWFSTKYCFLSGWLLWAQAVSAPCSIFFHLYYFHSGTEFPGYNSSRKVFTNIIWGRCWRALGFGHWEAKHDQNTPTHLKIDSWAFNSHSSAQKVLNP